MTNFIVTTDHAGLTSLRDLADEAADIDFKWPGMQARFEQKLRDRLIELADADFAERYLAQPLPRPPIHGKLAR